MSLPASNPAVAHGAQHRTDLGTRLDRVLGFVAAIILLGLMLLTTVDVISRKLGDIFGGQYFGSVRGSFELTELGLLVLIFAGLPLASRRGEHVTLDFVDKVLGQRGTRIWQRVVELLVGLVCAGLAWQIWIKAGKVTASGDVTNVLRVAVGPFVYVMTAMVGITALVHLGRAIWLPASPPSGSSTEIAPS